MECNVLECSPPLAGNKDEASDVHLKNLATYIALLKDSKEKADAASVSIKKITGRLGSGEHHTAKGLSFLEMKNHLLLSYLLDLTNIIWRKVSGHRIAGEASIKRLVEIRTVLERIRPIDQKLKYHIDKLVRTATVGAINADDPLLFRPNPDALQDNVTDDDVDEDDDTTSKGTKKTKAYVPPKLAPVHYDGDIQTEQELMLERAKRRALNTSIIEELRKEYYDGPEEVKDSYNSHKAKARKLIEERTEYEEDNMLRLTLSKKEMHKTKQLETMSGLSGLARFGDISSLNVDDLEELGPKKKKAKRVYKKKWGKKGFKKKWKH
ncbi:neuroguidin-like [Ornithodoros turicata]|uniref:neuroguidin-like n=1 Tax=Ornithodoros turicata TaxID=34597 RepID=UPI003139D384